MFGSSSPACACGACSSGSAYLAFNKTGYTAATANQNVRLSSTSSNWWITYYSPTRICLHQILIYNDNGTGTTASGYFASKAGAVYGSNDNSNWTQLTTYTNSVTAYRNSWYIYLTSNTKYFRYHKITSTSISASTAIGWSVSQIFLSGLERRQAELTEFLWANHYPSEYLIKY